MKTIKKSLIVLMVVFTSNIFSQVTHSVTYSVTSNINCNIGDTLKFYRGADVHTYFNVLIIKSSPVSFTNTPVSGSLIDINTTDNGYVVDGTETSFVIYPVGTSDMWQKPITISTTGISKVTKNEIDVKVFPNPFVDFLKVNTSERTSVNIFTLGGQNVFTKEIEGGLTDIDLSNLASGVYFVSVGENKKIQIIKQ